MRKVYHLGDLSGCSRGKEYPGAVPRIYSVTWSKRKRPKADIIALISRGVGLWIPSHRVSTTYGGKNAGIFGLSIIRRVKAGSHVQEKQGLAGSAI